MLSEHIIYSGAIAILVGMVFYNYTGRDSSWIIIICAWAPDLDMLANPVLRRLGIRLFLDGSSIQHGTFHNIAFMVIFGIIVAFLLHPFDIKFFDALFFSIIGFGVHLLEDALVYPAAYRYLWPFSSQKLGIGLLPKMINEENYVKNFFYIANIDVLIIGLLLLLVAFLIRTYFEKSSSWVKWYIPEKLYLKLSGNQNKPG
jgi:membrane-bound metal-dependent hydrolase YbcI (DUF457 family)